MNILKSKKFLLLIIFIFLANSFFVGATGLADSPWPTFRQNLKNTGLSTVDTSHVDGTLKWVFKPDNVPEDILLLFDSSATIGADGTIYVGSHENKFYAVNPDGTQKWVIDLGEPRLITGGHSDGYKKGIHSSAAVSNDGTIYIRSFSNYLYAINPDGTQKWKYELFVDEDSWSSPTIGLDGTIYVGSSHKQTGGVLLNGFVYAINPNGTLKWRFEADSDVFPTIAIADDGTIYAGAGGDGNFYAINPNGTLKWKFPTGRHTESSVAIGADGTLYFGNWDNYFYAVNPDGTLKWRYLTGGEGIVASPAIGEDGTVYINADDGYFYAFNSDGTLKWKYDTGDPTELSSSATIGADGTIYFGIAWQGKTGSNFIALNSDGTFKWGRAVGGISSSPTIGADGTVYIGTHDGLYAFGGSEDGGVFEEQTNEIFDNSNLYNNLRGKIILRVEQNGEAYYVHYEKNEIFYLGRPKDAFEIMRVQGLGISNDNLKKIPVAFNYCPEYDADCDDVSRHDLDFADKNKGKIFLQVENNGEAWYVSPTDNKRYYLGRPADAFEVMRKLGLGISEGDFGWLE